MKIVTDIRELEQPSEPVKNVKEGGEIARLLLATLRQHNKKAVRKYRKTWGKEGPLVQGLGLSAPQIGIRKRVCLVLVNEKPIVLMNPVIAEKSDTTILFEEGCMSLPDVKVEVKRHLWVTIESLNIDPVRLGPDNPDNLSSGSLLRSIVAQHELDHLDGRLIIHYQAGVAA